MFVQSVDTIITLDGIERKKISLENNASGKSGTWVEGIGSLDWIFVYPAYVGSVSGGFNFTCHSNGAETIFPTWATVDCNLIINTDDLKENVSFEIYPNPIEDIINIDFNNIEAKSIVIVSLAGNIILEKNINSTQNKLQISNKLEAGVYFAKVYRKDGVVLTKKFITVSYTHLTLPTNREV